MNVPSAAARPGSRPRRLAAGWGARLRDPQARTQLLLVLVFLAAAGAFAHLSEDYLTGDPLVQWDLRLARWLHVHSSPALVSLFDVVTWAGNAVVLALAVAAGLVLLARRGRYEEGLFLAGTALGVEVLNGLLKLAFHRPRPEFAWAHLDTYSFPSGHSAGSTAVWGAIAVLLARGRPPRARVAIGAAAVLLIAVIGFSRIYLIVHYLSDVLAGFSVGAAWLALCLLVALRTGHLGLGARVAGRLRLTKR